MTQFYAINYIQTAIRTYTELDTAKIECAGIGLELGAEVTIEPYALLGDAPKIRITAKAQSAFAMQKAMQRAKKVCK